MSLSQQLLSSLKAEIEKRGSSSSGGGPPRVHASSIGSCARQQTYRMLNYPQKPAGYYGLFQAQQGNWAEEGLIDIIKGTGFILDQSQKRLEYVKDERVILSGYIDGLIREDAGDIMTPWHLWECKGMSAYRYRKLVTNGVRLGDPGYYDQVQVYMTLLNDEGTPIDSCLFTAVAKDPSSLNAPRNGKWTDPIYVEEIKWDEAYGRDLLTRADYLVELADMQQLGPRERNPRKDWDCSARFCSFFDHCDPMRHTRIGG